MKFRLSVALSAFMATALVQAQMSSTSTVPATGGDIQVTALGHASVQLEQEARSSWLTLLDDGRPFEGEAGRSHPRHRHPGDHLDPAAITKLKARRPVVIRPRPATR